jgi:site-specific recombinase XerD
MDQEQQDAFQQWLRESQRQNLSTVAVYLRDVRHFHQWSEATSGQSFTWPPGPNGTRAMGQELRDYRAYLKGVRQVKPATVNRKLAALARWVAWGQESGRLLGPPMEKLPWEKLPVLAPKALEAAELNRLLRETRRRGSARDFAIVQLLAQTGLRVGELAALALGDVKLGERSGQVTVRRGKGDRYREVPLNADARQALKEYLVERPETGKTALWVSQRGGALTSNAIWRVVTRYAQFARVAVSPHGLRHTFCTRLLREQGADLVAVATLAGHSVATTARYTRPSAVTLAQLTEGLSRGGAE